MTTCVVCHARIPKGSTTCPAHTKESPQRALRRSYAWTRLSAKVRSRGVCDYCLGRFRPGDLEADHLFPLYLRPDLGLVETNVVALCVECHRVKTRHDEYERRAAWGEMG